jgi:hypothetical protein
MFRFLKNTLFGFYIAERRVLEGASSVVVYERGLSSDYFNWLLRCIPSNIDIFELRATPLIILSQCHASDAEKLFQYDNILFHSPGEVFQAKLLEVLGALKYSGQTIGFQHGVIGNNPPSGLDFVLARGKSAFYISFERNFSQRLADKGNSVIVEYCYEEPPLQVCESLPGVFDCYFDAPDKKSMLKNVLQIKFFLESQSKSLSGIVFHPSTSFLTKIIVRVFLNRFLSHENRIGSGSAICWDSKVKYELLMNGINVFKFDSGGDLCRLLCPEDKLQFDNHVRNSLSDFLSTEIN